MIPVMMLKPAPLPAGEPTCGYGDPKGPPTSVSLVSTTLSWTTGDATACTVIGVSATPGDPTPIEEDVVGPGVETYSPVASPGLYYSVAHRKADSDSAWAYA